MLHEFLTAHRDELIARARAKVERRGVPAPGRAELEHGVPLFLNRLTQILSEVLIAEPAANAAAMAADGTRHGDEMLREGFTIAQVVHDYGDICQAITSSRQTATRRLMLPSFGR